MKKHDLPYNTQKYGNQSSLIQLRCMSLHQPLVTEILINAGNFSLFRTNSHSVFKHLQGNSNVRALDLEDNQLGSKGAKHLASLLWDNTYIRSLVSRVLHGKK